MPTTRAGKVSVPRILVETVMDNNKTVMEEDAIDLFPSLSGGAKFQESPTEFVLRLGSELQVNELAARLKEYTNGLDKYEARTRFQRIIVTKKKQRQFEVQSDWEPSILYYEKAMELFGTVTSDVDTSGRISASGINFKHVFLDSNGGPNGKMQEMVRTLRELLEWIDSTVGTDNFSQGSVQERFRKTVKEWKSLGDFGNEPTDAPSGDNGKAWDSKQKPRVSNKPNMGEFRLMMIVEICILSGIIVRPHPDLHNLAYPVAGLAAKKQLFHVSEDEHHIVAQKVLVDMNMQKRGMNCFETTMCETWTDRVCKMYDHFFKRQHLFSKTEDGVPIIKRYGTYVWEPAGPARSKPTTDMNHSLL